MGRLPQEQFDRLKRICEAYPLPSRFAVMSLDTTGTDIEHDYVLGVAVGHGAIDADAKPVMLTSRYYAFDWSQTEYGTAVQQQLSQIRATPWVARQGGLCCDQSWWGDVAEGHGSLLRATEALLDDLASVLTSEPSHGVVGHGIFGFSWPMLLSSIARVNAAGLGRYQVDDARINLVDTGLIEKAIQMEQSDPWAGEPRMQWLNRMWQRVDRVKWNLASHCRDKYILTPDLSQLEKGPSAGTPMLMTYQLLQRYRSLLRSQNENWEIGTGTGQGQIGNHA